MATPASTAAAIVSAAQEKAAEISATGDFAAIQDGYRACSALVLRLAIESSTIAHPNNESLQVEHLDEILQALENNTPGKDKKAIVNQISDLLQKLVD